MSAEPHWVHLINCASGFEADLLRVELDAEHIPALVRGPQAGFLGGGFQGPVPGGVDVFVPSPALERARAILETRLKPEG